ncbi:MAG: type II secretion system F family protein [Gemmatimonadota bacterium]
MSLTYHYRAANSRGELVEGTVEAATERFAIDELRRRTLVPVDLRPAAARESAVLRFLSFGERNVDDELTTAFRTIATLTGGGAALERALSFAATHARNKTVAATLTALRSDVLAGSTLAAAALSRRDVLGELAPAMIRAGEESGRLDEVLSRLADQMERARANRAALRSALLYPALMGIVFAGGLVVLLTFVVPRFTAMLTEMGGELPWSTRLLAGASMAFVKWWPAIVLAVAAAIVGIRHQLSTPAGRREWHRRRLALRWVGEAELSLLTARFCRALGVLLGSGMGLLPGLRIASAGVSNEELKARLALVSAAVERGERLGVAVGGVLPPLATQLISVGEESASLPEMADRVAETYENEVQHRLSSMVKLVEPALIIIFGSFVGFVALAMLQAVYSINASVL